MQPSRGDTEMPTESEIEKIELFIVRFKGINKGVAGLRGPIPPAVFE